MSSRRSARELTLKLLFQEDLTRYSPEEIEDTFWDSNPAPLQTRKFAETLFRSYLEDRDRIDDFIRRHAEHWRLERIATVDRNILRMAICEFLYTDTPRVVVIDEAIEIARKYSGDESTEFVNGILDAVKAELEASESGTHD